MVLKIIRVVYEHFNVHTSMMRGGKPLDQLLRNSCPYMIYPTFSSPPTEPPISPSTNSSLHRTNTRISPHSLLTPHSSKRNPVPTIDASSCFTFLVFDPLRSSTGPSVRWTPFSSSYVFLFRFHSCSAFAAQHRSPVPFPLSTLYDSLSLSPIGSVMWQPTLNLT